MNTLYRMNLVNIAIYVKSDSGKLELERNNTNVLDMLTVVAISWAKDQEKVLIDYLNVTKD